MHSALVADSHFGVAGGIRDLIATSFETVVLVTDEASLLDCVVRLQSELVILDLSVPVGNALDFVRKLQAFPALKLIVISAHDQPSVVKSVLTAGAEGFVSRRAIAADLLSAIDAVFAGRNFVSGNLPVS